MSKTEKAERRPADRLSSERRPSDDGSAQIFAALGDPTRLALVRRLSDGQPRSISCLSSDFSSSRQAITKHLRVLEATGLVGCRQIGRERRFSYRPAPVDEARSYLETIGRAWDASLLRLKALVESQPE